MADVQLEHGHVRIANRLYEAMLDAEFTPTQFKILHGLIRLSYGWRRKTVTVSHGELAKAVHLAPTGTFRAALSELVAEGVVIIVARAGGHAKTTYAVQKDFTQWHRFAIHPDRLASIYDERPESHDELYDPAAITDTTSDDPARVPDERHPDTENGRVPLKEGAHLEAERVPIHRQRGCLQTGTRRGSKCDTPPQLRARKDRKDRKDRTTSREERVKSTLSSLEPKPATAENAHVGAPAPNDAPSASQSPSTAAKRRSKSGSAKPPQWPHFPEVDCHAIYETWTDRRGAVNYGQLRNAFGPLYPATGPRYELPQLINAIEVFAELAEADRPEFSARWNVRNFAADVPRWVRLGAMPHVDEWGIPTERGRATRLFGEAS